jgi:putative membrane protein
MSLALNWRRYLPHSDWRGAAGRLLGAWLISMLSMPILQWVFGERGLVAGVILSVILQGSLAVYFLVGAAGLRRTAAIVVAVALIAWASEAVGSKTGFPFGSYHYTDKLQPQVLDVPVLIPLAWLMMLPPAWAVAQVLTGALLGRAGVRRRRQLWNAVVSVPMSALAFTAWDLFLDPQMVHWGLWTWDQPGAYFGIPLVNYAGWLLVSGVITAVARPPVLPQRARLPIYTLTWLIETVGLILFWGLYGPALAGFLGMGLFVAAGWLLLGRRVEQGRG